MSHEGRDWNNNFSKTLRHRHGLLQQEDAYTMADRKIIRLLDRGTFTDRRFRFARSTSDSLIHLTSTSCNDSPIRLATTHLYLLPLCNPGTNHTPLNTDHTNQPTRELCK